VEYKRETLYKTTNKAIKGNFFINRIVNNNIYEIAQKGSYLSIAIDDPSVFELTAPNFNIGEVVRIKTKEEFAKDFVIIHHESLKFKVVTCSNFQPNMNKFCGKKYKIDCVSENGAFRLVDGGEFYFDPDMFIKLRDVIFKEV